MNVCSDSDTLHKAYSSILLIACVFPILLNVLELVYFLRNSVKINKENLYILNYVVNVFSCLLNGL